MTQTGQGKEIKMGRYITMELTKDEMDITLRYRQATEAGKSFLYDAATACWLQALKQRRAGNGK